MRLLCYVLLFSFLLPVRSGYAQRDFVFFSNHSDSTRVNDLIYSAKKIHGVYVDSAMGLLYQALSISRSIPFREGIARSLLGIGTLLNQKGLYQQSKLIYLQAMPYCKDIGTSSGFALPMLYNGLGAVFTHQGQHDSAIYYYFSALRESKKMQVNSASHNLQIYANLGGALALTGQGEQALHYLDKVVEVAAARQDTFNLASAHHNRGIVFENLAQSDSAWLSYLLALRLYLALPYVPGAQNTYYAMGRHLLIKAQPDRAKPYFDSAMNMDPINGRSSSPLLQGIGAYYVAKGQFSQAIPYYEEALKLCLREDIDQDRLTIYSTLAEIYQEKGKGSLAYFYQKAHSALLDTLTAKERMRLVNTLEIQYRTSEKDVEIARQDTELAKKESRLREKNLWIGGLFVSGTLLGLFFRSRYRHKQRLSQTQLKSLAHQQEIERLQARMQGEEIERQRIGRELHDGIGSLISATKMHYVGIGKENPGLETSESYKEVMHLLHQTGLEVRSVAYNLIPELLAEQSLPAAVQAFCELIQKAYPLQIDVQLYGDFSATGKKTNYSLYRIVQELLQNIIKHAKATEVLLQLSLHQDMLQLTVEDNGKGMRNEGATSGMGLTNLRNRVRELHGELRLSSTPESGTTVEIEIPLSHPKNH